MSYNNRIFPHCQLMLMIDYGLWHLYAPWPLISHFDTVTYFKHVMKVTSLIKLYKMKKGGYSENCKPEYHQPFLNTLHSNYYLGLKIMFQTQLHTPPPTHTHHRKNMFVIVWSSFCSSFYLALSSSSHTLTTK